MLPVLGLLLAVGCGTPPPPPPPPPPNVIVILVDTLRADRLGAYGSRRRLTPYLDELAAHGTVFAHAYAQCSWTAPSVASLFTSRFPSQHAVLAFGAPLDVGELTMAEVVQSHGYATGGFLANGALLEKFGFGQGFDAYQTYWPEREAGGWGRKARGELIGTDALHWLDHLPKKPERPVFLYLHYLEPHLPYSPPDEILGRMAQGRPVPDVAAATAAMFFGNVNRPDAASLRNIEDVYDAEVMSLDQTLRRTFAAFAGRHLLRNALVVVTADHGEEFEDHGHMGHGSSLYGELIHVPLIVVAPGQTEHVEVRDVVSLIDVAPTVADFAGAERPAAFEGRSLRPMLAGPPQGWRARLAALWTHRPPSPPAVSELIVPEERRATPHQRAIVLGSRKLIVGVGGEREQYDLARDPAEEKPEEGATDTALEAALREVQSHLGTTRPVPGATVPPDLRDRLKALGYIE